MNSLMQAPLGDDKHSKFVLNFNTNMFYFYTLGAKKITILQSF
jgi:hypothetical protein